ncbi:7552_t:CDS:2, partial [Racocetra persica]
LRGNIYRKLGLSKKALTDYNQALKLNPNDANILINRSKTFLVQKQYSDALRDIEKFIYYGGELKASVLKNRGLIYAGLSRHNDAITDFTMSLEKNEKGSTFRHRAKVYQALKQYKEALADLNQALVLDDSDKESLIMRNQVYTQLNRFDDAIKGLTKTLSANPNDVNALSDRGRNYMALNKRYEAMIDIEKALSINPNHIQARLT